MKLNGARAAARIAELLSEREREVFACIARGQPPAEIAENLGLRPSTVSTYRGRILEKLGLQSNAEIAVTAHRAGLVGEPRLRRKPAP